MTIIVRGRLVEITPETIQKTRQWFAGNAQACIDEATSGAVRVNDLASYVTRCRAQARDDLAGLNDHTVTFMQRALYIQTGECVPLLS